MLSLEDEFVDIAHRLRETLLAAQKAKDGLLLYFIERALFQAEKMAVAILPPSDLSGEQSKASSPVLVRYLTR